MMSVNVPFLSLHDLLRMKESPTRDYIYSTGPFIRSLDGGSTKDRIAERHPGLNNSI